MNKDESTMNIKRLKNCLSNHIMKAIEEGYLGLLRNTTMDMITSGIPDIFTFLVSTYRDILPGELKTRENTVDNMIYNHSTSVDTVSNRIKDFQTLCTLIHRDKYQSVPCNSENGIISQ